MVYGSVNWVSANGSASSTNIYLNTTKYDCIYLFYMSISPSYSLPVLISFSYTAIHFIAERLKIHICVCTTVANIFVLANRHSPPHP